MIIFDLKSQFKKKPYYKMQIQVTNDDRKELSRPTSWKSNSLFLSDYPLQNMLCVFPLKMIIEWTPCDIIVCLYNAFLWQ